MKWTYEEGIQKKTLDDGGGALWRGLLRRYLPFWSCQTVCSPWSMDRKSTLTIFLAWSTLVDILKSYFIIDLIIDSSIDLKLIIYSLDYIQARPKNLILFWIGSLLFYPQYLCQFLIKSNNQGQFQNQLVLRIPKLTLVVRFDQDLAKIWRVKENASISK